MVYDNSDHRGQSAGTSDLYDEPAFNVTSSKENPLFAEQSTYEGGDYGDYGQPDYADYNYPNGESGYNYMMGADPTYGNDGVTADEFGAVAGAVMASSQPTYGNDMSESTYGNDAAGFMMTGGFGEGEAEMGGADGYLDVNPDTIYAND